jgi:hypothetical protein
MSGIRQFLGDGPGPITPLSRLDVSTASENLRLSFNAYFMYYLDLVTIAACFAQLQLALELEDEVDSAAAQQLSETSILLNYISC